MPGRCFLGIALPRGVLHLLAEAERAFLAHAHGWTDDKWVRRELQHVTLKFIGPLPDQSVDEAVAALGEALSQVPPFSLTLSGVRAVPSPRRASMLWAVFEGDVAAAASLARACDEVLAEGFGVEADTRSFKPHTTLVRTRKPRSAHEDAMQAAADAIQRGKDADRLVSVRHVTLYSSTLGPGGPSYERLSEIPLG